MSNKLKKKTKPVREAAPGEVVRTIQERLVTVYVLVMMGVFPLFIVEKYTNILKEKFYFFFYATAITLLLCAMAGLVGFLGGSHRKQKEDTGNRSFFQRFCDSAKDLWRKLSLTDKFFYGFLLAVSVSTLLSEWRYEAFWGNMGRLQGMFYYLIVGVSYTLISRFYHYRRWHLFVFLLAGACVSLWGITDYFSLDIFDFRAPANDPVGMLPFSSSIGNINTLTGLLALYLGAAAALCIFSDKWFPAFPALFVFLCGLVAGTSDNAVLGIGAVYGLIPFAAFRKRKGIVRYLFMTAVLFLAMGLMGLATVNYSGTTAADYEWMIGILVGISIGEYKILLIAAVCLFAAGFGLRKIWEKEPEKETGAACFAWGAVCAAFLAVLVLAFVLANTGRMPAFLSPYSNILVLSDTWGTNRGYAWKRLFEFFGEFPFIKKLFGSGPETYAIFMGKSFYYEMQERFNVVFDSPHSEPLQILFTTGILGFVTYYGAVIAASVRGVKYGSFPRVFAFALIGATAASLVNISVPITTPLVFLSLAIAGNLKDSEEIN